MGSRAVLADHVPLLRCDPTRWHGVHACCAVLLPAAVAGHDNVSELALGEETFSYSTAAGAIVDFSYKGKGSGGPW